MNYAIARLNILASGSERNAIDVSLQYVPLWLTDPRDLDIPLPNPDKPDKIAAKS
jgi:hypothetical protein